MSETEKTASTDEDAVTKASSEPTVKQGDQPAEASASPPAATGQTLPQDATGQPDRTPKEAEGSTEAPPSAPVEQKKTGNTPLAPSKLEMQIAQHEKENAVPERFQESGSSTVDDITAYSQYLDGKSSSSEEPTPAGPLASRAMQVSREPTPSEL